MRSVFHDVLEIGVSSEASDWHIKEGKPVSIRIAGDFVDTDFIANPELIDAFVKEMADDKALERYRRDGDLDISHVEDEVGRFRVNIHRQRGGNAITMRHVKTEIASLNKLGLPPVVGRIAESPRGIVLICGTTGSGKSTTLASMLQHINNKFRKHIITIEDPIEYEFFDNQCFFEQREVGLDTISFYSALVHALRQDPDVIMIGEMRDRESFEAALQAADTGHLVMTTLHSTTAAQAINRILDFYEKGQQDPIREAMSINLRAIIAQRLMPRAIGGGVAPALEIMINTPIVRKLIAENKLSKLPGAIENSTKDGMQSFNQALLKMVNEGLVTEEQALDAATNPEALRMNLQGIFLSADSKILGD